MESLNFIYLLVSYIDTIYICYSRSIILRKMDSPFIFMALINTENVFNKFLHLVYIVFTLKYIGKKLGMV